MQSNSNEILLNAECLQNGKKDNPAIILLHGFSNSLNEWEFLNGKIIKDFPVFAVDLIGHGKSPVPTDISNYKNDTINNQLNQLFDRLNLTEIILCGYSMGGRAAINYAVNFPGRIKSLILESTTAGISDPNDRQKRILHDSKLAENILSNGINWFADEWLKNPLFEQIKNGDPKKFNRLRKLKLANNKLGLANSLIGFGTGAMPDFWSELKNIEIPCLLISGEKDIKFTEIAKKMNLILKNSVHEIINDAGHNTHLEMPDIFISLVNRYLDNYS